MSNPRLCPLRLAQSLAPSSCPTHTPRSRLLKRKGPGLRGPYRPKGREERSLLCRLLSKPRLLLCLPLAWSQMLVSPSVKWGNSIYLLELL